MSLIVGGRIVMQYSLEDLRSLTEALVLYSFGSSLVQQLHIVPPSILPTSVRTSEGSEDGRSDRTFLELNLKPHAGARPADSLSWAWDPLLTRNQ